MATINDIDTKSAVRKFLEQKSVINKEDQTLDNSDEATAILGSVALSFLLFPQTALSFIIQTKNILQQIVSTDKSIITYLLKALDDVDNPDEPITDISDLISAQTALIEIDRLGRISTDVRAYTRYVNSINSFLDRRLASSLKRRSKNEFERTGLESKQDLFKVLSVFGPTHSLMISQLNNLISSVDNFRSVALTRIVSTRTVARVRSSLDQIISGVQKQQLSKTSVAIELLSGSAALNSISNIRDIYDFTINTGDIPSNRTISISSQKVPVSATGNQDVTDLSSISTPWNFISTVDPGNSSPVVYTIELPVTGASGRCYVLSKTGSAVYNIPTDQNVLYVQFDGITPPITEAATVRAVSLPTGSSVSIGSILTALNDGSTGLIDGTAVQLGTTGKIVIYGSSSVTKITIKNGERGTFDSSGTYIPATGTVHSILGYSDEQTSGDPNQFSPEDLIDLISPFMVLTNIAKIDDAPVISTISTELLSSLSFSGAVSAAFGFSGSFIVNPGYLELIENGSPIDPSSVGVFIGSIVNVLDIQSISSRNLFSRVTDIDGNHLLFEGILLPRCQEFHVKITAPIVSSVQDLLDNVRVFSGLFDKDSRDLQRVLTPILSKQTLAQVNDAKTVIQDILDRTDDLLSKLTSTVVRSDRSEFDFVARQIKSSLEERGLDRALELLQNSLFSDFFSLSSDGAAKSIRFLRATEEVGRNDFTIPPSEQDQSDAEPMGSTPDDDILTGEDLLEDEEQL